MITTLKEYRKVFESTVKRKEDDDIFNYRSEINDLWRPIIQNAQKFQNINFDLENNDSTGEKKTVYVKKNLRKDQPVKYEFNIELCVAGGDWECPVMYFKVEFTHDYFYGYGQKLPKPEFVWDLKSEGSFANDHYVIIPGNEDGNHLAKTEKGYTAYTPETLKDAGLPNFKSAAPEDKKNAWKWLEALLTKLVNDRHEMLEESPNTAISEPSAVKENATSGVIEEKDLINLALGISLICNGEYGQTFWHKKNNHILVNLGDSNPFSNDLESWVKEMVIKDYKDYDKVKVEIADEYGVDRSEPGWFVFNDKDKFVEYK